MTPTGLTARDGSMKRRQLLTAFGLWGVSWAAFSTPALAWLQSAARPNRAERLLTALGRPESAAVVGRRYLAAHPQEADRSWLATQLDADLRCQDCDPLQADGPALRAGLSRQIRTDFARSRVVRVEGWVLSLTEARLCALAALMPA
jgi:hypothetical protein